MIERYGLFLYSNVCTLYGLEHIWDRLNSKERKKRQNEQARKLIAEQFEFIPIYVIVVDVVVVVDVVFVVFLVVNVDFFIVSHHQRLIHVRARSHSYLIAKLKRIISLTTHTHLLSQSFFRSVHCFFFSLSHSLYLSISKCTHALSLYYQYIEKYFINAFELKWNKDRLEYMCAYYTYTWYM